jgi:hypothetical protein
LHRSLSPVVVELGFGGCSRDPRGGTARASFGRGKEDVVSNGHSRRAASRVALVTLLAFHALAAAGVGGCAANTGLGSGGEAPTRSPTATTAFFADGGAPLDAGATVTNTPAFDGAVSTAPFGMDAMTQPPPTGPEMCDNALDDDGNGAVDDGCPCAPGTASRACTGGVGGTAGVGQCRAGTQACEGLGEFAMWGTCTGAVGPSTEQCADGVDNDCNGMTDEGCTPPQMPVQCTVASLTHVVGAADCAADHAVYLVDDGDGPNFICCPLPAPDILSDAPATVRGATCGVNEVITGAVGRNNFKCTAINTTRYALGAPRQPCYFGDGASGSQGVAACAGHPATFSVLARNLFGSDGCSAQPYGALFVRQSSKYCRDMAAVALSYTGAVAGDPPAGTPVVTFAP